MDINEYIKRAVDLLRDQQKKEADGMYLEKHIEELLNCEVILENRHLILMNPKVRIDIQVDKDENFDFEVSPREDDE